MRKILIIIMMIAGIGLLVIPGAMAVSCSKAGDVNGDSVLDLTDAISILTYLFQGGKEPSCLNSGDVNGDGVIDLSDPIYTLNYLFLGGSAPAVFSEKCEEGVVSKGCVCGRASVSSGYCCFGKYQDKACEYAVYKDSVRSVEKKGLSEEKIFLCNVNNPEECGPIKPEFQLTDSLYDSNPDIAHINYKYNLECLKEKSYGGQAECENELRFEFPTEDIAVWQRYENGKSIIYGCPIKGKESKECENNKIQFAYGSTPSVEFIQELNRRNLEGIERKVKTADIITVWQDMYGISGCIVEFNLANQKALLACKEQSIAKINKNANAELVLRGRTLVWKGGRVYEKDPSSNELYACYLKSKGEMLLSGSVYPLSCSTPPKKIDSGDIGPGTADAVGGYSPIIVYAKKIKYSSPEYAIYINGIAINFPRIPTLESIVLYNAPQIFEKDEGTYIIFKDINYQNPSQSIPAEHTIWILGGETKKMKDMIPTINLNPESVAPYPSPGKQQTIDNKKSISITEAVTKGLTLYRVLPKYHLSTEGENLLCNTENCFVVDKQLGVKQNSPEAKTGQLTKWNNFQNELLVCSLKDIGKLQAGGVADCNGGWGVIERVL